MANMAGRAISAATGSGRPRKDTSAMIRKADSTMRSPCARLTSRITPKISDRPDANSA